MRGARRGAPLENYMVEYQWFDSRQVHFTVHLCEAILLMNKELTIERCTCTGDEWRRISEGEARPGVFEGAKPLHQAPSGAARSAGGERSRRSVRAEREQKKSPTVVRQSGTRRTAATYSPNWWVSTIGDGELNFSVRNGKRWILTAITTAVYYLREKSKSENLPVHWINSQTFRFACAFACCIASQLLGYLSLRKVYRAISTGQLRPSPTLHFLPINVVVSHDPQVNIHLEDGFALRCFQRLS